jgi:HSP20 family molecular chaperone IbpA
VPYALRGAGRASRSRPGKGCRGYDRVLALPADADERDVTASYRDGILTVIIGISIEKTESAKKIKVKTAN